MDGFLRLAIQKSGRLFDGCFKLFADCGIDVESGRVTLKTRASNFPLEVYLVRDDDISGCIENGVADAGVVGLNVLEEQGRELPVIENLGFGTCRLSIAVERGAEYRGLNSLRDKKIATSHPRVLGQFLRDQGIGCEIQEMSGSVEIAPGIGLADAICDLVSSGSTLASNGLKEVEVIFRSEAVLVARPELGPETKALLDEISFRIKAVKRARHTKYIMLNAPDSALQKVVDLIPGAKSPSILPLATPGWNSVHSVVQEDQFWEVIGALKRVGAEGILVVPIEKMIV